MKTNAMMLVAGALMLGPAGCYSGMSSLDGAESDGPDGNGPAGEDSAESGESGDGGETDEDPDTGPGAEGACVDVGPRMLRRLSSIQMRNTLVSIFGDEGVPDGQVLTDPVVEGFKVDAREAVIRDLGAQQVMQYAETVADWAVEEKLAQIVPCQTTDAACRDQIVRELGAKFHREPLDDTMAAAYADLLAAEPVFEDGVRQLVAGLMQSPYFLYRRELGDADGDDHFVLTGYELASNLSYSLTGGPPDDALLALAADGSLRDDDVLVAEVTRLVQSAGGQDNLAAFVESWLEVDDLPSRAKTEEPGVVFDAEVRHDMLAETTALFQHVYAEGGPVEELYTAEYSFLNQRLGQFYGIPGASSDQLQRVELPAEGPGGRAVGLLGHGSVLARHALVDNSSPVARGVMVRRRLLCQELPDPPADVDTNLEPIPEGVTNRERYEQHRTDPVCAACHNMIDPVGYAFEHYDEFGLWRELEGGQPVDASGSLDGVSTDAAPLDGLDSLGQALAETEEASECFTHYMTYYTYGVNGCHPGAIVADAGGEEATLQSILNAIVLSPHFRERVLGE